MMQILCLTILTLTTVNTQDPITDFFKNSNNQTHDPFVNLVEVTSPKPTGFGSLDKCGEGAGQGINVCVPYHQCDSVTNTIVQDGRSDGFGKIDIRFGANECESYLDVCCKLPNETMKEPEINNPDPTPSPRPPSTSSPVTPPPEVVPSTPRPSSIYCGIRNPKGIDFQITGNSNSEAEYGEFPWMVAILRTNYDPTKHKNLALCGGSLIAPNVVLTGAHCVADLKLNEYKVRAGEWDTQTEKERWPYQERTVSRAIIHEDYVPKVLYNNVALLILSSPVNSANNIGTICLPNQDEVSNSRNCLASGWGKNVFGKEGIYQVILKKIELPMVLFNECQRVLKNTRLGAAFQLHYSFVCAGGERGKDTCTGDGGSPLVCPDPSNPNRYVLTGTVAWGIGCGEENIPGVYTNVAKFRNWIDDKLQRLNVNVDSYRV
ncbi:unnamed protein product [Ceutorhynchus assimilis]|uniref:Phenoloxidase-activating factor 2 n=1 Tax=Ceutorhynchus assimilis TaxID=467358 RepID=A0A9N9MKY6_9CUCU|nr:unnamed protein product [Ceutorhynchus assimilis]